MGVIKILLAFLMQILPHLNTKFEMFHSIWLPGTRFGERDKLKPLLFMLHFLLFCIIRRILSTVLRWTVWRWTKKHVDRQAMDGVHEESQPNAQNPAYVLFGYVLLLLGGYNKHIIVYSHFYFKSFDFSQLHSYLQNHNLRFGKHI